MKGDNRYPTMVAKLMSSSLIGVLRKIRAAGTFFIATESLDHLEAVRRYELEVVGGLLPERGRVLEVGGGTGWQAELLARRGYDVSAVDLATSHLRPHRVWPVVDYDGFRVPFDDRTFDVVYSSNVLEHIPHIVEFQKELHRVIKPGGLAIHVVPSASWRFWTNLTHVVKCWSPPRAHGEHAGNALSEIHYFSRRYWERLFRETGWEQVAYRSNGLFYTGHQVMDTRWSMDTRHRLSRLLGGSCHIFVLKSRQSGAAGAAPR